MQAYPNIKFGFVLPYLDDVVTRIPLDRLLLETDAPYFPADEYKLQEMVHILHFSFAFWFGRAVY